MTTTLHSYTVTLYNVWGYKCPHIGVWRHDITVDVEAPNMDTAFWYAVAKQEPDPRKRRWWYEKVIHRLPDA